MNAIIAGQQGLRYAELMIGGLSILFMGVLALLVGYLAYLDDAPPFVAGEVHTLNLQGEPQSVFRAGDVMLVHRDLCFTRNIPIAYGRRLSAVSEPKVNVFINSEQTMLTKGCVTNANVIYIPAHTPPGRYAFDVTVTYSNNLFQNGATKFPSPIIEVIR